MLNSSDLENLDIIKKFIIRTIEENGAMDYTELEMKFQKEYNIEDMEIMNLFYKTFQQLKKFGDIFEAKPNLWKVKK